MSLIQGFGNVVQRVLGGFSAWTTQTFVEANVKRGEQHFVIHEFAGVAVGQSRVIGVTTGPKPVLIKWREVSFTGSSRVLYTVTEGATFTGGNSIAPSNENRVNPKSPLTNVVHTPTVTVPGTAYRSQAMYGSGADTGNSARVGVAVPGRDVVLAANTQYLVTLLNTAGSTGYIQFEFGWFENDFLLS